jgi:hypothetical protein
MSVLAADLKHAGQSLRMLPAYSKIDDAKQTKKMHLLLLCTTIISSLANRVLVGNVSSLGGQSSQVHS